MSLRVWFSILYGFLETVIQDSVHLDRLSEPKADKLEVVWLWRASANCSAEDT